MISRVLSGVFAGVVAMRNGLYDSGRLEIHRLRGPVVSIGNISVGGSGKTPFTIALGKLLKERGVAYDVLSRGYRRESAGVKIVDPRGSPREFGDEPLLIARELGAEVVIGESRYAAGQRAEQTWGPRLHLLDDGFQHRRLARQLDIVLVSPEDLHDTLLPSGRLREPLASLARADAIVLTGDTPADRLPPNLPVWRITRRMALDGGRSPSSDRPIAFCGIAKPANFFCQLRDLEIAPVCEIAFRDHHRYTAADVRRLHKLATDHQADSFITTAKDAINLEEAWSEQSGPPLLIAKLHVEIKNSSACMDELLAKVMPPTDNR